MTSSSCFDMSQLSKQLLEELKSCGLVPNHQQDTCKSTKLLTSQSNSIINRPPKYFYRQNDEGDTQLHIAILLEKIEISLALIDLAPNPKYLDILNDENLTALHYAVMSSQPRIVRRLVISGANTHIRTKEGNTALHIAVQEGDLECTKALTNPLTPEEQEWFTNGDSSRQQAAPVDVNARNYVGQTPIHIAAVRNDVQIVHQLLVNGANVNVGEGLSGKSPLHMAIEKDNAQVIHYLAQIPTTLEATTYGGDTAYQIAVECNSPYIDVLVRNGASPSVHNDDNDVVMSEDDEDVEAADFMEHTPSYSGVPAGTLVSV